jgi:16S rRNA (uracil1498-N3)-methyltransferase
MAPEGQQASDGTRPPVFLAEPAQLERDVIVLTGAEGRHAATVRRLRGGERVDVSDGAGMIAECVVTASGAGQLELKVRARREVGVPDPRIAVVQAIPKGDRGELAVETMTEVGVDVIVPWAAERCVTQWRAERGARSLARWRAAAREAAKQARRGRVPEVTEAASADRVAARVAASACALLLAPAAAAALGDLPLPGSGEIVVIVGPEGGITAAENAAFTKAGATECRLGPSILRASTAGAVAAAVLLSRSGRW